MAKIGFAVSTVLCMAAFTLVLRAAMQIWPVGLGGTCSRVVTLVVLGSWVLATGSGWRRLLVPRGVGRWLVLMGVVSICVNLLLFASLKWTTATNNALLFRGDLLFVVLIGALLGLERVGLVQLLPVVAMFVGMALVAEVEKLDFGGHMIGDAMVVLGAAGFAVNAFVIRHILTSMDESAVALYNYGMNTVGFIVLIVVNHEWSAWHQVTRLSHAWLSVGLLGLLCAITLPLYYAALRRMAVWKLRAWMLAVPMLVALADWLFWGTRLSGRQCFGAVTVLLGLAVLLYVERPSPTFRNGRNISP